MDFTYLFSLGGDGYSPLIHVISFLDLRTMTQLCTLSRSYSQSLDRIFRLPHSSSLTVRPDGFTESELQDVISNTPGGLARTGTGSDSDTYYASELLFEKIIFSPYLRNHKLVLEIDLQMLSLLEFACLKGYVKAARYLMTKPYEIRYLNFSIVLAAHSGSFEIVKLLLDRPIAVLQVNKALERSLSQQYWKIAALLIEDFRSCLNFKNSQHLRMIFTSNQRKLDHWLAKKRAIRKGQETAVSQVAIKKEMAKILMAREREKEKVKKREEAIRNRKKRGSFASRFAAAIGNAMRFKKKARELVDGAEIETGATDESESEGEEGYYSSTDDEEERGPPTKTRDELDDEEAEKKRVALEQLIETRASARKAQAESLHRSAVLHHRERLLKENVASATVGTGDPDSPLPPIEIESPSKYPDSPPDLNLKQIDKIIRGDFKTPVAVAERQRRHARADSMPGLELAAVVADDFDSDDDRDDDDDVDDHDEASLVMPRLERALLLKDSLVPDEMPYLVPGSPSDEMPALERASPISESPKGLPRVLVRREKSLLGASPKTPAFSTPSTKKLRDTLSRLEESVARFTRNRRTAIEQADKCHADLVELSRSMLEVQSRSPSPVVSFVGSPSPAAAGVSFVSSPGQSPVKSLVGSPLTPARPLSWSPIRVITSEQHVLEKEVKQLKAALCERDERIRSLQDENEELRKRLSQFELL